MDRIKCILGACAFIAMLFVVVVSPVSAGLTVSGVTFDAEVAPGQSFEHEITVGIRDTDSPIDVLVDVFGYGQTPGISITNLADDLDTSRYSARTFVEVSPKSFHLEPGESQKVTVSGTMPSDVEDGGRYAVVNIRTLPIGEGGIGISLAANVPVRLTISGTELIETGEIKSVKVDDQVLSMIFENTGNHHYNALAEAIIKNEDGVVLSTVLGQLTVKPTIPTYSTLFKLSFEDGLAPGTYTVDVSVVKEDGTVLDTEEATFEV
ncbi:MAG TPA: hypothetical protein PLM24_07745 [Methanothrix sp.]|nr:hypothetical protein [Methanothrix sp.]HPJ84141.1 hypothetical protein [Methanothrix sp.]HPR67009.1 hypothetical protein [Methanothrix sp.]